MKIIKKGKLPDENKPFRFTCKKCGCVFEAKKEECQEMLDFGVYYSYKCPCCGIYVPYDKR